MVAGVTVRDTTPTMTSATDAAATRPIGLVATAQRLRQEIRFFDESTPTRHLSCDSDGSDLRVMSEIMGVFLSLAHTGICA